MEKCKGKVHLEQELKRIEKMNGEGVMLRKPKSLYVAGRSSTLLKVKSFNDAEAVVLAYEPGKGKHTGRVGALHCKMANGTRFRVGTGYVAECNAANDYYMHTIAQTTDLFLFYGTACLMQKDKIHHQLALS